MAPNKKKKKPATNPARGFATVSVASKVKESESLDEIVHPTTSDTFPPEKQANDSVRPATEAAHDNGQTDHVSTIEDMTPEELEAHLEDSELQTLLEANGAACKADAARQVSRLHAERRQLRAQAYRLNTHTWLEENTVDSLLLASGSSTLPSNTSTTNALSNNNSRRLLDLWILQRVLSALELDHLSDVMQSVVSLAIQGRVATDTGLIWGLAEALEWYPRNNSETGLVDYVTQRKDDLLREEYPAIEQPTQEKSMPEDLIQPDGPQVGSPEDDADVSLSEGISDDNEDDNPDHLAPKYLRLKRQLWKRQRKVGWQEKKGDLKMRRLQERITAIERDILFDLDAARAQWLPIEFEMQAEESRMRKEAQSNPHILKDGSVKQVLHSESLKRDCSDDEELFGDMFIAPGENLPEAQGSASTTKAVRLVNFGKWSGLSPLLLLEQTARSIDARAKIKAACIAQTVSSARHKVTLFWSGAAQNDPPSLAVASLPSEVTSQIQSRQWSVEMDSIAASNAEQSRAYASTLMLFLLLSLGGQEQQSTIRLPTIWRDEFTKLANRRKELVSESDRDELRELRKLIRAKESNFESKTSASRQEEHPNHQQAVMTSRLKPFETHNRSPEEVTGSWTARAASPTFQKMQAVRAELPIFAHKDVILQAIADNPVTIICAETGSGKSTQTGSFILERQLSSGIDCRILVTQPRRISAISLARRVCVELGEGPSDLGTPRSLIGYAIRLESKTSASTRLTFATTGVLLRMLESSPNLEQLDYLILDEVHERTIEMDLLFIALRRVQQRRPSLRIILMSATVDAQKFAAYFRNAPILDIPGRTYPVEIKFLEDAIEETNDLKIASRVATEPEELSEEDPDSSRPNSPSTPTYLNSYTAATRKRLSNMDEYRIDYDLITKLTAAIATKPKFMKYSSAILIFMPGIAEIRHLYNAISGTDCFSSTWDLHMLHSSFSTEELERAFTIPPHGRRKIVIATNIAETGITIPDVTAVIDTCKEKIMRFDERRQLSKLTEGFISRSSAKQRRGRAARVQDGLCFHLVTRHRHDNQMLEQQVPEMMRLSLQDPILRVKIWNLGSIEDTFQEAIDPPSRKNILRAVERLKDAGALGKSEQLTALGQRIARLPLDVTFAKLAILGSVFECVDPALAIISVLTTKNIFLASFGADQKSAFARLNPRAALARSDSDLITSLAAYEGWKKAKIASKSADYCRKNHLSEQNLLQVEDQKIQLLVYLVDGGILSLDANERAALNKARFSNIRRRDFYVVPQRYNKPFGDDLLLSLIAMSFYPRILTLEGRGWRNVFTNQQVSLRKESVNHGVPRPPTWLSFSEAIQTRTGNLNVSETSRIPDVALALLLGDADVKMFAGVVTLDNGRVKVAVKGWRQALALKQARKGVIAMLERRYRRMEEEMSEMDAYWVEMVRMMTR